MNQTKKKIILNTKKELLVHSSVSFLKKVRNSNIIWPIIVLAIIMLFNVFFTPGFFKLEIKNGHLFGSLIDILKNSTPMILIALGMTLVIATSGIDVSVGAVVAISGALAAKLIGGTLIIENGVQHYVAQNPMWLAILAALGLSLLLGLWNGFLVSWIRIQPIVATLILMVSGRGIAQLITGGQIITVYYKPYFFIGNGYLFYLPFSLYIAIFVLAATGLIMRKTAVGLYVESVGINAKATRYSGINTKNIILAVYGVCGLFSGVAGLIASSTVKSADGNNAGLLFELDAILAVVIGGTSLSGGKFFLLGSVVGVLVIQSLTTTIYAFGVAPETNMVVKAVVVFIVSLIQSKTFRNKLKKRILRQKTVLGA